LLLSRVGFQYTRHLADVFEPVMALDADALSRQPTKLRKSLRAIRRHRAPELVHKLRMRTRRLIPGVSAKRVRLSFQHRLLLLESSSSFTSAAKLGRSLPDHSQRVQNQNVPGSQQARRKNNRVRIAHTEVCGYTPDFMLRGSTAVWTRILRAPQRSLLPCNLPSVWHPILPPVRQRPTVKSPRNTIFGS
jgi:hypothetical protein